MTVLRLNKGGLDIEGS